MAESFVELDGNRWTFDDARPLGTPGGFGAVYVGKGSDGREVAIKILHASRDDGKRELDFAKGFARRTTKHVIPILDCGIDRRTSRACIVMEKAEKTLREFIIERSPMDSLEAAAIIRQIDPNGKLTVPGGPSFGRASPRRNRTPSTQPAETSIDSSTNQHPQSDRNPPTNSANEH